MTASTTPPDQGRGPAAAPDARSATDPSVLRATAVSHIGFGAADPDHAAAFYQRVLGMVIQQRHSDGRLRLGWGAGHHVIEVIPGVPGLRHYGFEVRDHGGLAAVKKRLHTAGVQYQPLEAGMIDAPAGPAEGIKLQDPDGTELHLHSPVVRSGENSADTGRRPIKYQHITLSSDDAPRLVQFYRDIIGFRLTDKLADDSFFWLRSDRDHHSLACVESGRPGQIDHYSYDLASWEDFKSWCDRLTELDIDVQWGPGRHGPGNNLFVFFDDPLGNHVELSAEMEKFHDDLARIHHREWTPSPKAVNLWGGQTPVWRRVGPS
ncbi:VOC family protein [Nesterenkonia muleiensis]|uniref:VOC family protein n=1 Tax=Nesterenkonia muleiensis TaxID=2282648 RepID=UPI000E729D12|nr:VOC family protein [Nesterenkonia muleiensis]